MSRQTKFPSNPILWPALPRDKPGSDTNLGISTDDDTQQYAIGTLYDLWDSKKFRYAKMGAADIAAGLMMQSAPDTAKHIAIAQTGHAHAAGLTRVTALVTTGGIAATETFAQENAIAGGSISWYTDGTPSSLVQSNDVVSSFMVSETIIQLELATPLRRAVEATEHVIITPNKYFKALVAIQTTLTGQAIGVPLVPLTAGNFGWLQTKGPCAMQIDTGDAMTIGALAGVPAANAIAGTAGAATETLFAFPIYGRVLQLGAADKYGIIDLMLE